MWMYGFKQIPFRVLNLVFVGTFSSSFSVAPVVLDYELAVRSRIGNTEVLSPRYAYRIFDAAFFPRIADVLFIAEIRHRPAFVRFAVKQPGNGRYRCSRNDLFNKDHASSDFIIRLPTNIESQVHF